MWRLPWLWPALWKEGDTKAAQTLLTLHADMLAADVLKDWWALSEQLYIRYNVDYLNTRDGVAPAVF